MFQFPGNPSIPRPETKPHCCRPGSVAARGESEHTHPARPHSVAGELDDNLHWIKHFSIRNLQGGDVWRRVGMVLDMLIAS